MRFTALIRKTATGATAAVLGASALVMVGGAAHAAPGDVASVKVTKVKVLSGRSVVTVTASCPAGSQADVALQIVQTKGGTVSRGAGYRTIECTGQASTERIKVRGQFGSGSAVIEAIVAADRELGSWQAAQTSVFKLQSDTTVKARKAGRAAAARSIAGGAAINEGSKASIEVTGLRSLAGGAAIAIDSSVVCDKGSVAAVFGDVASAGQTVHSAATVVCAGAAQTVTTVVLAERSALELGSLNITATVGNCAHEGCFNASQSVMG